MHIALYARAWPFGHIPNGIVTYVHCMRAALMAEGHRVSLFAELIGPGDHGPDVYPVARGVRRRLLGRLGRLAGSRGDGVSSWGEAIADAMARVHRRTPIDIIEMEEAFGWCADVQRLLDVPVVVKLHGPAFLTEIGQAATLPLTVARAANEGRALAKATAVISPSRCALDAAVQRYGPLAGLLEHVPNPLVLADSIPLWRCDHCERRTILFVGKFDWIKGGDVMLRAFARLLDRYPDAELVFVGPDDGVADNTGNRTHLAAYAQTVLGAARVKSMRFLGRLDADLIPALRVGAAMTVVASRWENQCYTALEAMAQGCPTVAPDTGGMSEIIDDGVTGLLCRVEDPEDMCRAMSTLFDEPALGERLGRRAREYVLAMHAPTTLARRTAALYERVVKDYASRRARTSVIPSLT